MIFYLAFWSWWAWSKFTFHQTSRRRIISHSRFHIRMGFLHPSFFQFCGFLFPRLFFLAGLPTNGNRRVLQSVWLSSHTLFWIGWFTSLKSPCLEITHSRLGWDFGIIFRLRSHWKLCWLALALFSILS